MHTIQWPSEGLPGFNCRLVVAACPVVCDSLFTFNTYFINEALFQSKAEAKPTWNVFRSILLPVLCYGGHGRLGDEQPVSNYVFLEAKPIGIGLGRPHCESGESKSIQVVEWRPISQTHANQQPEEQRKRKGTSWIFLFSFSFFLQKGWKIETWKKEWIGNITLKQPNAMTWDWAQSVDLQVQSWAHCIQGCHSQL